MTSSVDLRAQFSQGKDKTLDWESFWSKRMAWEPERGEVENVSSLITVRSDGKEIVGTEERKAQEGLSYAQEAADIIQRIISPAPA